MACLLDLAGKILDRIIDIAVGVVKRHVGYIVRYKKNIKELEEIKIDLVKKMENNERVVDEANVRNDIVEINEEAWSQANNDKTEVENLMIDKARVENMKCLRFSCPNICSRYRISKQAVLRKGDLEKHIQSRNLDVVIRRRPPPPELQFSTDKFMNFDSRVALLKLIKDKVKSGDPKDKMIGVHGAGGIGKTTAVVEVGKQLKNEGFLQDYVVGVVSRDVNVFGIQCQIAKQLGLKLNSQIEEERRGELWNRLNNGKNNLVILDNLWEKVKLRDIGIPLRQGNKGCKVILTTRNRHVLRDMELEVGDCIPVEVLSENEAWVLFEKKVKVTFDFDALRDVAKSVCKRCSGLPVAILAVAGALVGSKDISFWNVALRRHTFLLSTAIDEMHASLRLSYDYLAERSKEAKSILLLCCLYPEDDNIPVDFLLFHCIARSLLDVDTVALARIVVIYLVGFLKDCSLLLDGIDKDHVKMHDVIRDVVISIAKTEEHYLVKNFTNYWPVERINENMAAISVRLNKLKEVPKELVCPQLHTLRIECEDSLFHFPDNFFSGVGDLTVLELIGKRMSCTTLSLANLSKLRTLILIQCRLGDISFLKDLKSNLEVLVIRDSHIEALPTELGDLSHLRVLLFNNCYQLKFIPTGVISKLTHLEELCLPDKFNFFEERESEDIETSRATLSELSSLTRLTNLSVFIPDVPLVPDLNFGNLVSYRIAVGGISRGFKRHYFVDTSSGVVRRSEIFDKFERYCKDKNLVLCGITYQDKFVTLLERAQILYLNEVKGLKNVLLNIEGERFSELECFFIGGCHDLEHLLGNPNRYRRNQGVSESRSFSNLTVLVVSRCSFKFLFTSSFAKGLMQLEKLEITACSSLEEIVGTEGENEVQDDFNDRIHFSKLKDLRLLFLPKLISFGPKIKENATVEGDSLPKGQSLFNEKVAFPSMEILKIKGCSSITNIWDRHVLPKESFSQLKDIEVVDCERVEFIVLNTEVGNSTNEPVIFQCLKRLELRNLRDLRCFCGSSSTSSSNNLFDPLVAFPSLAFLWIVGCSSITNIWDRHAQPMESFPQLEDIVVGDCERVEFIVLNTEVGNSTNEPVIFQCLKSLELGNLRDLRSFCGSSSTSSSNNLFDPLVAFPSLGILWIEGCSSITNIWDRHAQPKESFSQLWHIEVRDCERVEFIVLNTEVGNSTNEPVIFQCLKSLELRNLRDLRCFCGSSSTSSSNNLFDPLVAFPSMEILMIKGCSSIRNIWDRHVLPKESFSQLKDIKVVDCERVEFIVLNTEVGNSTNEPVIFQCLKSLKLRNLRDLQSFCGSSSTSSSNHLFDPLVAFPSMEILKIKGCSSITNILDRHVLPKESFSQLKDIKVVDCERVEFIVLNTEVGNSSNGPVIFQCLKSLELRNLRDLRCFCGSSSTSSSNNLFDPLVAFPSLEMLTIEGCSSITNIWDRHVLPKEPFLQLKNIYVGDCERVEFIVLNTGVGNSTNETVIFQCLESLRLLKLGNLKSFCGSSSTSASNHLFDPQVHFPALEEISLENLPNIEIFKKQLSKGEVQFPAIRYLVIDREEWYSRGRPNMIYFAPQLVE